MDVNIPQVHSRGPKKVYGATVQTSRLRSRGQEGICFVVRLSAVETSLTGALS